MEANTKTGVEKQILHFQLGNIWKGGYFEGDPLDPLASSQYSILGYMSVLHATYLVCIKPYVNENTRALEIGPGRGAWTRCLLDAKEVVCLDALSAEHNGFWEYVGQRRNVTYHQVRDFECRCLPDNHFDYLFSFGTFCHISPAGSREYFRNLYRKLTSGAHAFVMIADWDKRKEAVQNLKKLAAFRACNKKRFWPARVLWQMIYALHPTETCQLGLKPPAAEEELTHIGFHYLNVGRACDMLTETGFEILHPDVGTNHRDPIIHFVKP